MLLNAIALCFAMFCCYVGYIFIFSRIRRESKRNTIPEHLWGISLGCSDITASTISIPYFIAGLILQREFLPKWVCVLIGFVDNIYLAASVWTIVMWSIHRLVYIKRPSNTNGLTAAKIMIVCIWVGSIALALPPVFFAIPYQFSNFSFTCCAQNTKYLFIFGFLCIVLPIIVISIVFVKTYQVTNCMELKAYKYRPVLIQSEKELKMTMRPTINLWIRTFLMSSTTSSRTARNMSSSEFLSTAITAIFKKRNKQTSDLVMLSTPIGSVGTNEDQKKIIAKSSKSSTEGIVELEIRLDILKRYRTVEDLGVAAVDLLGNEDEEYEENVFTPEKPSKTKMFHFINIPPSKEIVMDREITLKEWKGKDNTFKSIKRDLLGSVSSNGKSIKTKSIRGRKRSVLILLCMFISQIMSTLPIFILFAIVTFGGSHFMPTSKMVTLMTTLLVCNTGFNPMIRIAIRPGYKAQFAPWLLSGYTYFLSKR